MKAFWISIVIFATMVLIIILNYLYILQITDKLCTILQGIPSPTEPQCVQEIIVLERFWEKHHGIINLSTAAIKTDTISSDIVKLKTLALTFEISDFEVTRNQLFNAIYSIKETEQLSLKNII